MKTIALWTALLGLFVIVTAAPVRAQTDKVLTDATIRAFMEENLKSYMLDYPDYEAFLRRASHKDFVGTMDLTITLPGQPPVKNSVNMNYDQVIEAGRDGYNSVQNAELTQIINDIKMAPGQQKASISYTLTILNQLLSTNEPSGQSVLADSVTQCTDDLVFTAGTGPQIIKSVCTTEVTTKPQQEL